MSKRRSESQLTKDQFDKMNSNGFNFSANRVGNGAGGGPDDVADPSMMADRATLSQRKIAPLKRGRGGARAGARTGGGDNLPNLFSGVVTGVTFGAPNGTAQQQPPPQQSFAGFAFGAAGNNNTASAGFGGSSAGGSFEFGANNNNGQQEQPKANPFASLGPSSNGSMFQTPAQPQATSLFGGNSFGSNNASQTPSATPNPSFQFGAANNTPAPAPPATESFSKTPSFAFGSGNPNTQTMFGGAGDSNNNNKSSFTFGAHSGVSGATSPAATPAAFGSFGSNTGASSAPLFGSSPSPAPVLEKTPEPTPAIADPQPPFSFGAPPSSTGNPLFSKPSEPLFKPTPSPEPLASNSFFGARKPTPSPEPSATSPGLFGSQTTASAGSGSLFNSSATPAKPPTFSGFGPPTQPSTPKADEKPPTFSWGPPKEEPKKVEEARNTPFGGFCAQKIDSQQEAPTSKPFTDFGREPEEPAKQLFGSSAPSTVGTSLFGKPVENKQDTPAPSTPSFFGKPANASTPNFFGKPAEAKQDTPAASTTGFFGKPTPTGPSSPSTSNFFAKPAEVKQDTPVAEPKKAPTFGGSPITFGKNSVSTYGGSGISSLSPAPINQFVPPASPALKVTEPTLSNTANARTPSPPLPSDATSWAPAQLTEYYNLYGLRSLNYRFLETLMKADQFGDWSSACEIYVREASRIKACQENGERYKGASGDAPAVGHTKRALTEGEDGGGKRRKEEDSTKASNFSNSALGGGNTEKGGPQKLSSAPLFGFKPPTPSTAKSSSSSESAPLPAAPVFGFRPPEKDDVSNLSNGRKLASGPVHGFKPPGALGDKGDKPKTGGSVFDNPSAPVNNGGFVNPFSKASTEDIVVEGDDDDNEGISKEVSSGKSLFDRISEPVPDKKDGGFFGGPKIGLGESSLFGKKVDDVRPSSLFGSVSGSASTSPTPAVGSPVATSSLFGNSITSKPEVGFSFGGPNNKPAGSISVPSLNPSLIRPTSALSRNNSEGNTTSAVSTPGATDTEASEPNDNAYNAKNDLDLSGPGPGEEDEDSKYQMKALVYESTKEAFKKTGSGTLRVLKNRENGKARIVVRTDIGKVILNVGLNKALSYVVVDDKKKNSIRVAEFLPGGTTRTWLVRVKLAEDATRLATVMNEEKL